MMLWSQEGKQLWRTPFRTLALCLALALLTGTFAIAYGLKQASLSMYERVEAEYHTVAYVPSTPAMYLSMKAKQKKIKNYVADGYISDLLMAYEAGKLDLQVPQYVDAHSHLMAYDSEKTGVVSQDFHQSQIFRLNQTRNTAIFAVKCVDYYMMGATTYQKAVDGGKSVRMPTNRYSYVFEVVQAISLHEDFEVPSHVSVLTTLYNLPDDLTSAVKVGETYLIWGFYDGVSDGVGQLTPFNVQESSVKKDKWESDEMFYVYLTNNPKSGTPIPLLAHYTGSPEEHIARDTTGMWETMLKVADLSQRAFQILSADHPYTLTAFIEKNARLKEGDFFSEEELESGAKVVMVSEMVAEKNGLEIGDTLELSFYQSDFSNFGNVGWTYYSIGHMIVPVEVWGDHAWYSGEPRRTPSDEDGSYTVVGIFSTDGWVDALEHLHPNTVIVPQAALTEHYPLNVPEFDYTFVLPNGAVDAFEAELEAAGLGGSVHYDDQGYSTVIPGVDAICRAADFVWNVVRALWVLAVIMILLIFTWMQMPTGKVKYRLGAGRARIWGQMSFSALIVVFLSCLGGFAASVMLYDRALAWTMQADFTSFNVTFSNMSIYNDMLTDLLGLMGQTPDVFAKVCAAQLAALLVLAVLFAAMASLRKKSFKQ